MTSLFTVLIMGWVTAYLAEQRGRRWYPWFAIGCILNIFGPALVFVLPRLNQNLGRTETYAKPHASQSESETIEVKAVFVPKNSGWFFLDSEREQKGPLSLRDVRKLWTNGQLAETTFVWNDDMTNWKRINEIDILYRYLTT